MNIKNRLFLIDVKIYENSTNFKMVLFFFAFSGFQKQQCLPVPWQQRCDAQQLDALHKFRLHGSPAELNCVSDRLQYLFLHDKAHPPQHGAHGVVL